MCYSKLRAGRSAGIAGYDANLSPPRLPSGVAVDARFYGDSGGHCVLHRCVTNRPRGDTEKLAHRRLGKPGGWVETPPRRLHVVACAGFSSCQLLADFYLAEPLLDDPTAAPKLNFEAISSRSFAKMFVASTKMPIRSFTPRISVPTLLCPS